MVKPVRILLVLFFSLSIGACGTVSGIFGGGGSDDLSLRPTAIGVNGFLWQATLDTLSFMPLDQAEPSGGLIITDWYSVPDTQDERVKVAVRFLSDSLRSDGLRVTIARQKLEGDNWVTVPVQAATGLRVEEAILVRARQLTIEANK